VRPQVKRILLISIVLLAVGALIFGLSFYFLYIDGVQASQKKLNDVQEVLRDLEQKEKELGGLQKTLTTAQIEANQAKSKIPSLAEREFDNFVRHLYAIAKQTLVEPQPPKAIPATQARRPGATPIPQGIVPATYDLTLTGDFRRLWDFLGVLEKSARFVELEAFSFTPFKSTDPKAATREGTKLTIRITAYATEGRHAAAPTPKPKGPAEPAGEATTRPPE
jgi:hypothetical protein